MKNRLDDRIAPPSKEPQVKAKGAGTDENCTCICTREITTTNADSAASPTVGG